MTPDQQQNLKQNLSLKIQLATWAASEQKSKIYQQSLTEIEQLFAEFFDMQTSENKNFLKAIVQLKSHTVYYDYPSDLASLNAITALINEKPKSLEIVDSKEKTESATEVKQGAEQTKDDNQKLPEGNL